MPHKNNPQKKRDARIRSLFNLLINERLRVIEYLNIEREKEFEKRSLDKFLGKIFPRFFNKKDAVIKAYSVGIEEFEFQIEQCRFGLEILPEGRYVEIRQILAYIRDATYKTELPNGYKKRSSLFALKEIRLFDINQVMEFCNH